MFAVYEVPVSGGKWYVYHSGNRHPNEARRTFHSHSGYFSPAATIAALTTELHIMAKAKVKTTASNPADKDSKKMRYGSAWYVAEPTVEIYIFINEEPSGLPENAAKIVETTKVDELLNAVEPYFVLGSGS